MRRIAIAILILLWLTPVAMGAQAYRFSAIGDIGQKGSSGHDVRAYGAVVAEMATARGVITQAGRGIMGSILFVVGVLKLVVIFLIRKKGE